MIQICKKFNAILLCIALLAIGCKQAEVVTLTTKDVNIAGYINTNPNFSKFRKIMQLSGTKGFLQTYGAYTLFLPTDAAIDAYLVKKGVSSVEELGTPEQLKDLVYFHLIEDSLKTTSFGDGKLKNPTMYGQYLVTGAANNGSESTVTINKQANLIKSNLSFGNGIVHEIDNVLIPSTQTVAQIVESNPKFSIFAKALRETKFYDRLNKTSRENQVVAEKYLTIFAETNEALAAAGYDTYEKLKNRFSKTGDPSNPSDSLYLYVAYHVATSARFYPELITTPSAGTLAVPTLSFLTKGDDQVVIDEIKVGDSLEVGAPIKRSESDLAASNGVVHTVTQHFRIVKRSAQPVYYDLCDQPEFRKLPQWRTGNVDFSPNGVPSTIARIKFGAMRRWLTYVGSDAGAAGHDFLQLPLGDPSRPPYYDITTPFVAAGKYRMWICYKKAPSPTLTNFYFNGKKLSRQVELSATSGYAGKNEEEREQAGWKQYVMPLNANLDQYMARSLGIVEVTKDGPQVVRIEAQPGFFRDQWYFDMIHLIPEGMNQLWPRFDANGNKVNKP